MSDVRALPHAYPFLLIDRIITVDPAVSASARRQITATDPLLADDGRVPPALLMEAIAQCAGLAVAGGQGVVGGVLVSFDRFRTAGWVEAGHSLEISARVVRRFGALVKARGRIRANGRLRAAAEVVLRLQG